MVFQPTTTKTAHERAAERLFGLLWKNANSRQQISGALREPIQKMAAVASSGYRLKWQSKKDL
jgi:hypothetical protein